ncbi:hypothetical protein K469DRAFT_694340 [Zopfia rhizophila CBS 207.26]|uniref:Uncharacterized protein n=1 Tax=Zopfia rhizophila CBS 207.26 TaxID=1314779 RepID=A0A6A6EJA4_9PEZI|nr:hypothetical protein K469DRAFT_694340 [Zopfia rhizophila CBS 207.26]
MTRADVIDTVAVKARKKCRERILRGAGLAIAGWAIGVDAETLANEVYPRIPDPVQQDLGRDHFNIFKFLDVIAEHPELRVATSDKMGIYLVIAMPTTGGGSIKISIYVGKTEVTLVQRYDHLYKEYRDSRLPQRYQYRVVEEHNLKLYAVAILETETALRVVISFAEALIAFILGSYADSGPEIWMRQRQWDAILPGIRKE